MANIVHAEYTPSAIHQINCSCNFCSKLFNTNSPIVSPASAPVKWAIYEIDGAVDGSIAYRV